MTGTPPGSGRGRPTLGRRGFLAATTAAGLAPALTGCAGLTRRVSTVRGSATRLTVQVYGTDVETAFYAELAQRFEQTRRGVAVDLVVVPFAEASTGIDAGLAAGTAPDVFRVDYPTVGVYASAEQLLDVTDAVAELEADTAPAFMRAVSFDDRRFGVAQHVDTSALVYRPDVLEQAGVGPVPDRLEDAWSWEEFADVADRVAAVAPDGGSAFAVNWQALGAFRWLNWLFQAGGHLYADDLSSAALVSEPGRRALDFTRSFFERGWVPRSTSPKAATFPDALFTSGRLGMLCAGNFLLPAFADTVADRFAYAVTYLPRDERPASELGGNALVANRAAANPELAAEFLVFAAEPQQMADFCAASVLLPTRTSLLDGAPLDFALAGELMGVYSEQVGTIDERDVADVTTPSFAEVNDALADELDLCFLEGRGTEETLQALAEQVDQAATLNLAGAGER